MRIEESTGRHRWKTGVATVLAIPVMLGVLGATEDGGGFEPVVFTLVKNSGIDFVIEPSRTERRHQPETMISGIAVFDYDNDGILDIYLVSGATMPGLKKTLPAHDNRLYKGVGDGTFVDVTEEAGVQARGYTQGVAVADYDNDGHQDMLVLGVRENIFYRNLGNGKFEDVTRQVGLGKPDPDYGTLWSVAAAFFDYDKDGWLDLFISNYCVWDPETEPVCGPSTAPDYCHPQHYDGLPNQLFRNNGDGTFTDVSVESGIRKHIGKGMGLGMADFDEDGWIDVYVANDTVPAFLFRNNGDGTFSEIGFESGTAYTYSGAAVSGMGVDARDVNNDGLVDIFVAAMTNEAMPYYVNTGDNYFDEMTAPSRLASMTRDRTGWSNGIFDFNNDGWKDLFVASGDVMDPRGSFKERVPQHNSVFVNLGNGRFADGVPTAGEEFATTRAVHRGAAFGDFNGDGRVDVVVSALNGPTEVWLNNSNPELNWLWIEARGTRSNRAGMGTKIRIKTASGYQYNHVNTAVGYACASDRRVHFGLGRDPVVEEIQLTWLSGQVQVLKDVAVNQFLKVTEPE
jgi:enediyne biosynthesis protein E4